MAQRFPGRPRPNPLAVHRERERMKPLPARAAVAVAFAVCLLPQFAVAQSRPFEKVPGKLEMKLKSSHPLIRSGAPFALELEFLSTFLDVIEGPLELTFFDDNQVRLRFYTTP